MSDVASGDQEALVTRLNAAVGEARKKNATKAVVHGAAVLFAEALQTRAIPPRDLFNSEGLSPRVAGPGLAMAWGQIDEALRDDILVALEKVDKALRHKTLAILGEESFASDPKTAVRALAMVLTNKEVSERLTALLEKRQSSIPGLSSPAIPVDQFWTVLGAFVAAAERDPDNRGPLFALLRVGIRSLDDQARQGASGAATFASWLRANLSRQPEEFLRELPTLFGGRSDLLQELGLGRHGSPLERPGPEAHTPGSQEFPTDADAPRVLDSQTDEGTRAPTAEHWRVLGEWTDTQRVRVEALDRVIRWGRAIEQDLARIGTAFADQQSKARAGATRADQLNDRLQELTASNDALAAQLVSVRGQLDSLMHDLAGERTAHRATTAARDETQARWESERLELLERVEKTAAARVQHFRERLADAVARELSEGLPVEESPVSAALGGVLLSRLHGIVRLLSREGVTR